MRVRTIIGALSLWAVVTSATAAVAPAGYWTSLREATGIREGRGPVALIIFFDPNCPYCHHLYGQVQALLHKTPRTVEWIPVGVLTMTSYGKAAALLRARNKSAALAANERGFAPERGGAITPRRATVSVKKALAVNEKLLGRGGAMGVPFVVYRTRDGKTHTITGDPPNARLRAIWAAYGAKPTIRRAGP